MKTRAELQAKLEELLGSDNVYYQPPSTKEIKYPAIIFSKNRINASKADDSIYIKNKSYEIIVIDKKPDNPVIDKLLDLPYCSYDRNYKADNLNHDVLKLYY
jgi:hypothetical protein